MEIGTTEEEEKRKKETIEFIQECDKIDFYDLFEECRKRHNKSMLN